MKDDLLKNKKHIHFIGIGGSGMYPLAQILHSKGYYLTGSDNNETETLEAVRKMGIPVFMGQRAENIKGADLIVYSAAIMKDNPELIAAKESEAEVIERSELLGYVTGCYDNAVCISGTHGKTTTSSMLTQIFVDSNVDLTCVIGGKLPAIGGSGRAGKSDIMVCEACEFVDTFLRLYPDVAVILNVDADHLEYFKTIDNIKKSFIKFANNATKAIIYNGDDKNTVEVVAKADEKEKISFGFSSDNDYCAKITAKSGLRTDFDVYYKGEKQSEMTIFVPGDHNVLNALAAIVSARYEGIEYEDIKNGLYNFKGAIRRFQKIDEINGITIVDDYAHHPAELSVTLNAAKALDFKRIWAVFQPLTYSRTKILLNDFKDALSIVDIAVITDIMGSREKNTIGIYSRDLARIIPGSVFFDCDNAIQDEQTAQRKHENFQQIVDYIADNAKPGDLVITCGCGDVYKLAKMLSKKLKEIYNG